MKLSKLVAIPLAFAAGAFTLPASAAASLYFSLDGTNYTLLAADGDNDGVVAYVGTIAGSSFTNVNILAGQSKPTLGTSALPKMDVSFSGTSSGSGALWIAFSDTGFTTTLPASSAFSASNNSDFSINISDYYSSTNALNARTTQCNGTLTIANIGTGTGSCTVAGSSPFSITQVIKLNPTGAGQLASIDSRISVPEPGTLALFGIGLIGLGLLRRKITA